LLLADPDFGRLIDACRDLEAMPEEQRLKRLQAFAYMAIEDACTRGDVRVALFVLRELDRGRNPARTVAEGVVRACKRAASGLPEPAAAPAPATAAPSAPRPRRVRAHPGDRSAWRVAAGLRRTVSHVEVLHQSAATLKAKAAPRS
jgi:hypothetical protein